MSEFDPGKFEDKYAHYFTELQRAYKNAFDTMNDAFESDLIHAIDQTILNESEPFFEMGSLTCNSQRIRTSGSVESPWKTTILNRLSVGTSRRSKRSYIESSVSTESDDRRR